ncbi:hypothetical protein [Candidatus Amarolinea dominans]|uniref:hypothetical protein n=1 Tax=Candidatus Amarolinea dominans TaxID=3140696 RepID=UPI0031CC6F8A
MLTVLPQPMGQAKQKVCLSWIVSEIFWPLICAASGQVPSRQLRSGKSPTRSAPGTPPAVPSLLRPMANSLMLAFCALTIALEAGLVRIARSFLPRVTMAWRVLGTQQRFHAGAAGRARMFDAALHHAGKTHPVLAGHANAGYLCLRVGLCPQEVIGFIMVCPQVAGRPNVSSPSWM